MKYDIGFDVWFSGNGFYYEGEILCCCDRIKDCVEQIQETKRNIELRKNK